MELVDSRQNPIFVGLGPPKKADLREKIGTNFSDHPDWHLDFFFGESFQKSREASQRLEEIFKENFHLSNKKKGPPVV